MTLAIFESIVSILLKKRVRVPCESILVSCYEDSGNAAVRYPALVGIKLGLL